MKLGTIFIYSSNPGLGAIQDENKETYVFDLGDWLSEGPPAAGATVKFHPDRSMARHVVLFEHMQSDQAHA